ncbi:MAG: hypothetical protein LBM93_11765, partial [Oscillospiraceae bacterium]|nr:hypothetical protein [Oscillospiraceae bacterium]
QKELFNEKFNAEKANLEISVLKCSKEGHFRITMIFMAIGLLAGFYGGCLMNKLSVPTQILIFLLMLGTGLLTAYLVKPKNKKEKIKEEIQ